jgi:hypothetical protein
LFPLHGVFEFLVLKLFIVKGKVCAPSSKLTKTKSS